MAVVIAFRIAIALAPIGYRLVNGPSPSGGSILWEASKELWSRLQDPNESDAALSSACSDACGSVLVVTTFDTTFELRKLVAVVTRNGGGTVPEDKALIGWHFIHAPGGVPDTLWTTTEYTAIESAWTTALNVWFPTHCQGQQVTEFRWYKVGPQIEAALGGPGRTGPPVRTTAVTIGTTSNGTTAAAPQMSLSVTEKTADAKAWGRFYLPGPVKASSTEMDGAGRLPSALQGSFSTVWQTAYQAAVAAACPPVVYSPEKPARQTKKGTTLPAIAARALSVDAIQLDDIYDVIRSRRWTNPLARVVRTI